MQEGSTANTYSRRYACIIRPQTGLSSEMFRFHPKRVQVPRRVGWKFLASARSRGE